MTHFDAYDGSFINRFLVRNKSSHVPNNAAKLRITSEALRALMRKQNVSPSFASALAQYFQPPRRAMRHVAHSPSKASYSFCGIFFLPEYRWTVRINNKATLKALVGAISWTLSIIFICPTCWWILEVRALAYTYAIAPKKCQPQVLWSKCWMGDGAKWLKSHTPGSRSQLRRQTLHCQCPVQLPAILSYSRPCRDGISMH
jgi:hypothetical protein